MAAPEKDRRAAAISIAPRSHDAANALHPQLRIEYKFLQFVSERVQRYVGCAHFNRKTVSVPSVPRLLL